MSVALVAGLALSGWLGAPAPAAAQALDYATGAAAAGRGDAAGEVAVPRSRRGGASGVRVTPYIEAAQIFTREFSPRHEMLTWTTLAAGADGGVAGRTSEASFSVRYEHRFGWGKSDDSDTVSGLVRGSAAVGRAVRIEAGALATRTAIDGNGAGRPGAFDRDRSTQLYSVYAGPSFATRAGPAAVNGAYRIGYTRVGSNDAITVNGVPAGGDVFDHSTTHVASVHAGVRPGELLPVGIGAGAGYHQEDIGNLDQRVRDFHARADVTVPLTRALAAVGGIGFEHVEVSSRDALRDAGGMTLVGSNGRYLTDRSAPRRIGFEASGVIWDVGVLWRPSRRTALEAHFGRRYGSDTMYGAFGWRPNARTAVNVSAYDNVSGLGGQVNRALTALPTGFAAIRDPVSGDVLGCVVPQGVGSDSPGRTFGNGAGTGGGSNCITGALGSVRSAAFRARGVQASYAVDLGRLDVGAAAGHDRRKFIGAPGTVLAAANGVTDAATWVTAWLNGRIDRASVFGFSAYAAWHDAGFAAEGDGAAFGASASYGRSIGRHLSATAALGIQGITRERVEDIWSASALVGVRYSF